MGINQSPAENSQEQAVPPGGSPELPILKFYLPTYAGVPSLERLRNLRGPLSEDLEVEVVQSENSTYLKDIDPNLRTLYLSDWICSLQVRYHLPFDHAAICPFGRFNIDFFADGIAVLVLTVFANPSSPARPEDVYDINTMIVSWIDKQDPKIAGPLSTLITKIRGACEQETNLLNAAKGVEMSHGSIYAGVCSIVNGSNLEEGDKSLLCRFLLPDYTGLRRVPKHVNTDEFLAERIGDMVLHASWEGLCVHGRIHWPDVLFYDIITRMNHHIWTACFYLDRLASTYVSQQASRKELTQNLETKSQYKQMTEIRTLRARFLAIKSLLTDFDSRLNIRVIELLKVSASYGNLDHMLNAAAEKIDFLVEEYTERFRINEQLQSESLNARLQILALLIGTLGTVGVINSLLQIVLMPNINLISRVFNLALSVVPAVAIGTIVWWFGFRKRPSS